MSVEWHPESQLCCPCALVRAAMRALGRSADHTQTREQLDQMSRQAPGSRASGTWLTRPSAPASQTPKTVTLFFQGAIFIPSISFLCNDGFSKEHKYSRKISKCNETKTALGWPQTLFGDYPRQQAGGRLGWSNQDLNGCPCGMLAPQQDA